MEEKGKVEPIFSPVVTDFLSNYVTTYGWAAVTFAFFRVMPIQREWHYIDWQADREAVDQMLPVFDRAYYCTGTCNNGKD